MSLKGTAAALMSNYSVIFCQKCTSDRKAHVPDILEASRPRGGSLPKSRPHRRCDQACVLIESE